MPHLMGYAPGYVNVMDDEHIYGTGRCSDIIKRADYISMYLGWDSLTRKELNDDLVLIWTWWQALKSPGALTDRERLKMTRGLRNRIALIAGLRPGVSVDYRVMLTALKRRQLLVNPSGVIRKTFEKNLSWLEETAVKESADGVTRLLDLTKKLLLEERVLHLLFTPGEPFEPSPHVWETPLKNRGLHLKIVRETPAPQGMAEYVDDYMCELNHLDGAAAPPAWHERTRQEVGQDLERVQTWWKALQENTLTPLQRQIAINGLRNRIAILAGVPGDDRVDYAALDAGITTRRELLTQKRPARATSSSAAEPPTDLLVSLLATMQDVLSIDQTAHLLFQAGDRVATMPGNESIMPIARKRKHKKPRAGVA